MLVSTLVSNVKRKTQVGDVNVTTDQATTDIISFLVNRMFQVWRSWPWDWILYPISFTTVVGTTDYTLNANVGGIIVLTAGDGYIKPISLKRYMDWFLSNQIDPVTGLPTTPSSGTVTNYVKIGRDASNNLKIRLWRPPNVVATITGFAKQRLTKPVIADIAAGNSIQYFPDEVCDILESGVAADIYETMGNKEESDKSEREFKEFIEELKSDGSDFEDVDPTTELPDMYVRRKRRRRGTIVA